VNLPRDRRREPQTGFGIARAQCAQHSVFVLGPKRGLVQQRGEIPVFDLKMPYTLWADTSARRAHGFDCHSRIAFALQEPPRSFDDTLTGVVSLALADR